MTVPWEEEQPAQPAAAKAPPAGEQMPWEKDTGGGEYTPAANPTRWSELARTWDFLKPTFSDVPAEFGRQVREGFEGATRPSEEGESWLSFVKSLPGRAMSAASIPGAIVGAPAASLIGHPFTAASHAVQSVLDPKKASMEAPGTAAHPMGGQETVNPLSFKPLGEQVDLNRPHDPYNQIYRPGVMMGLAATTPKGFTASPKNPIAKPTWMQPYQPPKVPARTLASEDVFGPTSAGYKQLRQMGVDYDPSIGRQWITEIQNELKQEMGKGVERNAPGVWGTVEDLGKEWANRNTPISLDEMDSLKRGLDKAFNKRGPDQGPNHEAAMVAKHKLNDLLMNVDPADVHIANPNITPAQAIARLNKLRGGWATGKRMQMYEDAMQVAENKGGNLVDKLKTAATSILNKPRMSAGIPADEIEALRSIASGGPLLLRLAHHIGQASPLVGITTGGWMPLALDMLVHGFPGTFSAATAATHKLAEGATRAQWDRLLAQTAKKTPIRTGVPMTPRPPGRITASNQALQVARELAQQQNSENSAVPEWLYQQSP